MIQLCRNSPLKYVDLDGNFGILAIIGIGAAVGAIHGVVSQGIADCIKGEFSGPEKYLGAAVGGAVVGGALSLAPVTGGLSAFGVGAVAGGVNAYVSQVATKTFENMNPWGGEKRDIKDVFVPNVEYWKDISFGALAGGIVGSVANKLPKLIKDDKIKNFNKKLNNKFEVKGTYKHFKSLEERIIKTRSIELQNVFRKLLGINLEKLPGNAARNIKSTELFLKGVYNRMLEGVKLDPILEGTLIGLFERLSNGIMHKETSECPNLQ